MSRFAVHLLISTLLLGLPVCATAWQQDATRWSFSTGLEPESSGQASLRPRNGEGASLQSSGLSFGNSADWGLPRPVGGHTGVLRLSGASAPQGLRLIHAAAPNGVFARHGKLSNYSLIADVLWPNAPTAPLHVLNSTPTGADPAELAIEGASGLAQISVDSAGQGALRAGRWHRLAITVQAASGRGGVGQIHVFADGRWLGAHMTPGEGIANRWALDAEALLFGVEDSSMLYLANLLFVPRMIPHEDIENLGGSNGRSVLQPGRRQVETRRAERRVGIVAHRGNSCCAPENTLVAIQQALDLGVEGIELDVRLSADGHAILMHDETVDRTTSGQGRTSRKTLAQLRDLDAGSWFDPRYAGTRVPTLAEVLEVTGERSLLYLDIKDNRLAPAIARALKASGHSGRNLRIWEVDNLDDLRTFRRVLPDVAFHWGSLPVPPAGRSMSTLRQHGVVGFELPHWQLNPEFLQLARHAGMPVTAYTIYDPQRFFELIRLGVDLIETDFPRQMQRLLPARDLQDPSGSSQSLQR